MKYRYIAIIAFLVLALVVMPASAFHANELSFNVQSDGSAHVSFSYALSTTSPPLFSEQWLYDHSSFNTKENMIKTALLQCYPSYPLVANTLGFSNTLTQFSISNFATIKSGNKFSTKAIDLKTPADNFIKTNPLLSPYQLFGQPDYDPDVVKVTFPKQGSHNNVFYSNGSSTIPAYNYP